MKEYISITIIVVLLIVNLIAFIMYAIDKSKAKRDEYRISEAMLLLIAALGGSVGAMMAMTVFRHKTQHKKFTLGVPGILLVQIIAAVAGYIYYLMNIVA